MSGFAGKMASQQTTSGRTGGGGRQKGGAQKGGAQTGGTGETPVSQTQRRAARACGSVSQEAAPEQEVTEIICSQCFGLNPPNSTHCFQCWQRLERYELPRSQVSGSDTGLFRHTQRQQREASQRRATSQPAEPVSGRREQGAPR